MMTIKKGGISGIGGYFLTPNRKLSLTNLYIGPKNTQNTRNTPLLSKKVPL